MKLNMFILDKSEKLGIDNNNFNINQFIGKLQEEFTETKFEADMYRIYKNEDKRVKLISETLDTIQVCLGLLDMLKNEGGNIEKAVIEHNKKLFDRGWTIKKNINIEVLEADR